MPKYKALTLDDKMPFGKYKDWLVKEMIEKDPSYYQWIKKNTNIKFNFSKKSKKKKKSDKAYLDTVITSGKYKGLTVAEIIRCDLSYAKKNLQKHLDYQALYYLKNPDYVLVKLNQILNEDFIYEEPSTAGKVQQARYLRDGMYHMLNLRIDNPIFEV